MQEALDCFEQAIQIESNFSPSYSNKGILLLSLDRVEEARVAFEKAIEYEPDNPLFMVNLVRCYLVLAHRDRDVRLIEVDVEQCYKRIQELLKDESSLFYR